jgi:serine/threonine protein kinase
VDYWAFGCLLFELVCGHTPFESSSQQRTFEKIVHSQKYLTFPQGFDPHCKSLIRRLLHPNSALRIGALQNGIVDIKTHAFFTMSNIPFDLLLRKEVMMPFCPPFTIVSSAAAFNNVDLLDVEFELSRPEIEEDQQIMDEYDSYFANLDDTAINE